MIIEAELLELSFVAVPCNPNALSLDQKELLEENGMIEEVFSGNKENEEVGSSSFHENCCGDGGVKDSTNDSIIQKDFENTNRDVLNVLIEIRDFLKGFLGEFTDDVKEDSSHLSLSSAKGAIIQGLEK